MSIGSIIVGALAGLVVTLLVTYLWPAGKNRHLGAVTGALLGFGIAYLVMTQVKI